MYIKSVCVRISGCTKTKHNKKVLMKDTEKKK